MAGGHLSRRLGTLILVLGCLIVVLGIMLGMQGLGADNLSGPLQVMGVVVFVGGVMAYGGWRLRRSTSR